MARPRVNMVAYKRTPATNPRPMVEPISAIVSTLPPGYRFPVVYALDGMAGVTMPTTDLWLKRAHEADSHTSRSHHPGRLAGGFAGISAYSPCPRRAETPGDRTRNRQRGGPGADVGN